MNANRLHHRMIHAAHIDPDRRVGGVVLNELGVPALAFGVALLAVAPVVWIGALRRRPALPVAVDAEAEA